MKKTAQIRDFYWWFTTFLQFWPFFVKETVFSTSTIARTLICSLMISLWSEYQFPSCLNRFLTYGKYCWVGCWSGISLRIQLSSIFKFLWHSPNNNNSLFYCECTLFWQKLKWNSTKIRKNLLSAHKAYVTVII